MAEDVHRRAKEIGTVCSVTYPLPSEELKQHGIVILSYLHLGGGGGGGGGSGLLVQLDTRFFVRVPLQIPFNLLCTHIHLI
jgi:hypothetical protein